MNPLSYAARKAVFEIKPIPGLSFNGQDGKHIHLLDGNEIPGCTTISGLFQDDSWKFSWPVKLMEEKILEWLDKESDFLQDDIQPKDIITIVKKAKNAWREKRDKSADTGTAGHAWIEKWIKDGYIPHLPTEPEILNIALEFKKWQEITKPVWIASELQVGSRKHIFAGILDALAEIDGKLVLVDFKTSDSIYLKDRNGNKTDKVKPDYIEQLAGLMICLEEMGVKPTSRAILHLPKEGKYEFKILDGNLEFEKEAFLAAKNFYSYKSRIMGGSK